MKTPITFRDTVILRKYIDSYGHSSGKILSSEKTVRGCAFLPSVTLQNQFEATGKRADLAVHLWRRDFDITFTHASVNGTEYRIVSAGASVNDLYIKLVLQRGF